MEDDGEDGRYLSAYPIEGDLWSATAGKEMVISPEVTASKEEIAAQCLWHTSFYGFTQEEVDGFFEQMRKDIEETKAIMNNPTSNFRKDTGVCFVRPQE